MSIELGGRGGSQLVAEQPGTVPPVRGFSRRTAVLYALAAVFLSLVIWRSRIWEAGDSFEGVDPATLVVVPLLSLFLVVPLAIRGREVLAAMGHRFSIISVAPLSYYGNTVGFMTPAASGELLRPSLLERGFGVPVARGAGVVLYERIFSMYIMCLTGMLAFTWTRAFPLGASIALLPAFLVIPFAPLVALRLFNLRIENLSAYLPRFIQARVKGLGDAGNAMDVLWRSPALTASFAALSGVAFGIAMLQFWLLIEGTGESVTMSEAWVVLFASSMAGFLSGLPMGLGATDAVMVSLLSAYGVDLSAAAAITVLTRVLIHLPTGIFGSIAYLIAVRQSAARGAADKAAPILTPGVGESP